MKIRLGFVSNSSSSSFVIITTREAYELAKNSLNDLGKQLVETELPIKQSTNIKLGGNDYIMFFGDKSSEDFGCCVEFPDGKDLWDGGYEELEEQWDKFQEKIVELGGVTEST